MRVDRMHQGSQLAQLTLDAALVQLKVQILNTSWKNIDLISKATILIVNRLPLDPCRQQNTKTSPLRRPKQKEWGPASRSFPMKRLMKINRSNSATKRNHQSTYLYVAKVKVVHHVRHQYITKNIHMAVIVPCVVGYSAIRPVDILFCNWKKKMKKELHNIILSHCITDQIFALLEGSEARLLLGG